MGFRKLPLVTDCYYHVYNRSIAEFEIFRFEDEYLRMRETIRFYRTALGGHSYSEALKSKSGARAPSIHGPARVQLIAYCLMTTHIHFLLQQTAANGTSDFLRYLQGSYASYFNMKTRRKGPLWEGRFGARLITTDEDLLHMTRYIHLNPTSAGLVKHPDEWKFSSLREYLGVQQNEPLCNFKRLVQLSPEQYKKFAEDRMDYQRSLQAIKAHLMD